MNDASQFAAPNAGHLPLAHNVRVLMATYNGAPHLREQIASIAAQADVATSLLVSDDGSSDDTLEVLKRATSDHFLPVAGVISGPRQGFASNFRKLILSTPLDVEYYAFSDQDDIWEAGKLRTATDWLASLAAGTPGLFCSRTRNFDDRTGAIGLSPRFSKPPSFRNAIVQSIAGANTMVLNRAAFALLQESCRRTEFVSHDWWAYMIVTGAGGSVNYTAVPHVRYRQHNENLVGANNTLGARLYRLRFAIAGRFAEWTDRNIAGLDLCRDLLEPDACRVLDLIKQVRGKGAISRLRALVKSGAYRQTWQGQAGLYAACALGKL